MRKTISGIVKFHSLYEAAAVCLLAIVAGREDAFVTLFGPKKGYMTADRGSALDEIWSYFSFGDHNIITDLAEAAKPEWADDMSDEQITHITGLLARGDFEEAITQLFKIIGECPVKYVVLPVDDLPEDVRGEY